MPIAIHIFMRAQIADANGIAAIERGLKKIGVKHENIFVTYDPKFRRNAVAVFVPPMMKAAKRATIREITCGAVADCMHVSAGMVDFHIRDTAHKTLNAPINTDTIIKAIESRLIRGRL